MCFEVVYVEESWIKFEGCLPAKNAKRRSAWALMSLFRTTNGNDTNAIRTCMGKTFPMVKWSIKSTLIRLHICRTA